jgi:phosphatidate cytidylyltransferase
MAYTVWLPKGDLLPRILTGLIAIPAVLFIIFQDPIFLKIIGVLATFGLLREWSNLSFEKPYHWLNGISLLAILVGFIPILKIGAMLMILAGCCWLFYLRVFTLKKTQIVCGGYLYITSAMAIIVHIMPNMGSHFILLVLTLILCVDTGAFLAGKTIGGPKLAPAISPNKTWAGFIGGAIIGLVGVSLLIAALQLNVSSSFWIFACISVLLAQGGDLLESWCKRYFNVKDSGNFLPGHGGMLDRLDSLLAVSFAISALWYFCG